MANRIVQLQNTAGTDNKYPVTHIDAVVDANGNTVSTLLNAKQATLVSGTNIKTINNTSVLGSGNISAISEITTTNGITGGPITSSGSIGLANTIIGTTTVSSITSIPVTNRTVLASVSTSGSLSFAALPGAGLEVHVIIHNTSSNMITITLPNSGNYICTNTDIIDVKGSGYAEVNIVTISNKGYVRASAM